MNDLFDLPTNPEPSLALTPLQKAHARMKELRESGELVIERLDPVERARSNPASLRTAITAHCWVCCGAGADPNTRQSIRDCAVLSCSLHPLRPWQKVGGKSAGQMSEEEIEAAASFETNEAAEELQDQA